VDLVSRIDQIIGVWCKRARSKRRYSAKKTCSLIDPTNCSHPIALLKALCARIFWGWGVLGVLSDQLNDRSLLQKSPIKETIFCTSDLKFNRSYKPELLRSTWCAVRLVQWTDWVRLTWDETELSEIRLVTDEIRLVLFGLRSSRSAVRLVGWKDWVRLTWDETELSEIRLVTDEIRLVLFGLRSSRSAVRLVWWKDWVRLTWDETELSEIRLVTDEIRLVLFGLRSTWCAVRLV